MLDGSVETGFESPPPLYVMKNILILDTETTGTDPTTDRVVEVGAVLWSVEHATRRYAYSALCHAPANPARHINGIPEAAVVAGPDAASVWARLDAWVGAVDAIVAHSASFDRSFTPAGWDQGKPWICSMADVEWPHSRKRKLVDIALDHGLGVARAHRALTDCELVERLLERCHEMGFDVADMLMQAARPKVRVVALTPPPWKVSEAEAADTKAKLAACGFTWDSGAKVWSRMVVEENATAFPFAVEVQRAAS